LNWWTTQRLESTSELLFEHVEEPSIVSLELSVDAVVAV
jgi:hypothetical protein